MFEYEAEIDAFARCLQDFIDKYELPNKWFALADHIAIKCADADDYEYKIQDIIMDATQGSEIDLDGRRLAALQLTSPQEIKDLGQVSWLEIMEPRPEKIGKDIVGIEHIEFYYPTFDEITEVLEGAGVAYRKQANPGHEWISIVLNQQGHELKLNNRLLQDIVAEELQDGTSHLLFAY